MVERRAPAAVGMMEQFGAGPCGRQPISEAHALGVGDRLELFAITAEILIENFGARLRNAGLLDRAWTIGPHRHRRTR